MAPFSRSPPERRNFLRFYFLDRAQRERAIGWEGYAAALLAELRAESPEFAR